MNMFVLVSNKNRNAPSYFKFIKTENEYVILISKTIRDMYYFSSPIKKYNPINNERNNNR
ncbi:hypothetical protein bsdtb5_20130 [Anaeromicropila herbilytica]|uniref:Uncharacterized protein n=1 Tax=Anaeromicropila herbilytica TaxID=2785025 RepID=A0A7R7EL18_9FIRM|nr:hypothetical protein bsdtb5_20130 [Anaeromicropila herbilytica]